MHTYATPHILHPPADMLEKHPERKTGVPSRSFAGAKLRLGTPI